MGLTLLRDDEADFIDMMRHSSEVRKILATGERGAQRRAAKRIHIKYLEKFADPLPGETDEQFEARRSENKKAKRLIAEDADACKTRKEHAFSRILGVLKRRSQNSSRRRRPSEDVDDEPPTNIPARKVLSTLIPPTSAYREFQASDHPARPRMASNNTPLSTKMSEWNANLSQAYRSLPAADLDRFKFQAASKNSERLSAEQSELRRAKHAAEMTSYMHTVMKTWQSQSGWVGWCAMGGLDANGQPVYHSGAKTGKDRHGLTLQERFAREFQCTPAFIDGIIQSWVLDIFDAPQAAKPLLSLSTGAGSGPSISLSAVTGNVSPKQPPVLSPGKVGDPVPERAAVALAATDAAKRADTSISTPKSAANNQFNPFDETFSSDGDDDLAAELEKDIQKKVGGDVVVQTATIVPKLPAVEVGQAHKATKSSKPKMLYEAKQSRSVTGNPPVEPPAKPLNHKSTAQQSTRGKRRGLDTATSGAAVTSPLTVNEAITKALAATEPAKKSVRPRPKVKKTNEALSAPAGDESLQNAAKGASPVSHHDGAKKASVRVVTRSGRVRVPTARSLEESPDMSAAKKLNATKKRTREDADSKGTGKKTRRA